MLCLPKEISQKFKEALKSGKIDIPKLMDTKTTSEQRTEVFAKVVGEDYAKSLTLMFEKKMILKDQQAGMIDFVKTAAGLKEQQRKDLIGRINKMDKVFNPTEQDAFLNEVADNVLGDTVTKEEAKTIFELSKKVDEAKIGGEVKDFEGLISSFEKLDQKTLTEPQQKLIKEFKDRIADEKAIEESIKEAEKVEKEAIKEAERKEREAIKEAEKEELKAIREQSIADAKRLREREVKEAKEQREMDVAERKQNLADMKIANGRAITNFRKVFNTRKISEFPEDIQNTLNELTDKYRQIEEGADRLEYGRAKVELENYVAGLMNPSEFQKFKTTPIRYVGGTMKSMASSLDDSAIGRQGWKTLFSNPKIWLKSSLKTFKDIYDTFGGKAVADELRADIVSRPNYLNGNYAKMKLAVNIKEEQFPTALPEKIPYAGRVFAAADNAFSGFQLKTRADLADLYIKIAENNGVELSDSDLLSYGKLINSQTGRGGLGKLEPMGDTLNVGFFSIRKLTADFNTLTAHILDRDMSWKVKRQAAKNLLKIVIGTATILAISSALNDDSVDFDPRSTDFGKIKINDTRFDISAGMASIITLASRLITQESKSSVTGDITKINSGDFMGKTGSDLIGDFLANKESPMLAILHHWINGEGRDRKPFNLVKEVAGSFVPLPVSNAVELWNNPNAAPFIVGLILDGFGFGANTYSASVSQQHQMQIEDEVKKNYEAKQTGGVQKSSKQIAKEIFGDGYNASQLNKIDKTKAFYKEFGEDNKLANEIRDMTDVNDILTTLEDAKKKLGDEEFKKFYKKATKDITLDSGGTMQVLITNPVQKKWEEYQKTGKLDENSGTTGQTDKERSLINIISSGAEAMGTDPMETFKLIFQNQSIQRVENGQIIINRNTNLFDRKIGQSGYSEQIKKDRDANKDQILDHTIPVAGGGLEKGGDVDNLLLLSEKEWKRNTPVEVYLIDKLKSKDITGPQLREYIVRYKAGRGQTLSDRYMNEYNEKYGGKPLTFEEIKQLLDK